jgi:hypothetical protein
MELSPLQSTFPLPFFASGLLSFMVIAFANSPAIFSLLSDAFGRTMTDKSHAPSWRKSACSFHRGRWGIMGIMGMAVFVPRNRLVTVLRVGPPAAGGHADQGRTGAQRPRWRGTAGKRLAGPGQPVTPACVRRRTRKPGAAAWPSRRSPLLPSRAPPPDKSAPDPRQGRETSAPWRESSIGPRGVYPGPPGFRDDSDAAGRGAVS